MGQETTDPAIHNNRNNNSATAINHRLSSSNGSSSGSSNGVLRNNGNNDHHTAAVATELELQPLSTNKHHHSFHDVEDDDDLLEDGVDGHIMYPNNNNIVYESSTSSWIWWLPDNFNEYFFPVETPPECQLFRRENIAIPACYLLVGLLQGLSSVAVNVLPLDLGASEAQQTTISGIRSLPASFKLVFGFWSDNIPLAGYRRKPYMLIGWCLSAISMTCLWYFSNLNIPARNAGCFVSENDNDDNDDNNMEKEAAAASNIIPDDAPSIPFLSVCLLFFGIGFWLADVMGDSIVAEKAKLELPNQRGSIQSTCYACRFFGMMVAAPASTALYSMAGPQSVILLLSILPLSILPLVYMLGEIRYAPVKSTIDQCGEIWNTVCSRAVWQPMGFVYLYNVMQVGNAAWREYLVTVQHFTSCQLNILLIVSFVLLYFGILAYKYWFISWSWRNVYIATTLLNGFFSILQVLLIYGITFGLSPFLFTLGDDAFAEFIAGIQFLPTTIMMVHLCPAGSEGASYAMFTTVNNAALTLSSQISTLLLHIWDVSRTAFENGDVSGMVNLTYLTTACQTCAIFFVCLLPHYKEDLAELGYSAKSRLGGLIFLIITFGSILWAINVGVTNILGGGGS